MSKRVYLSIIFAIENLQYRIAIIQTSKFIKDPPICPSIGSVSQEEKDTNPSDYEE